MPMTLTLPGTATSSQDYYANNANSNTLKFPSIDAAIQKFEGWFPGSVSQRNNNPGNVQYTPYTASLGATGADSGGYAVFPDYQTGQAAEDANVGRLTSNGQTLSQLLEAWNGKGPNTPNYIASVAADTGLDPNSPVTGQLASAQPASTTLTAAPGATTSGGSSTTSTQTTAANQGGIVGAITGVGSAIKTGATALGAIASFLGNITLERAVLVGLGLVLVAGGLYLFKPVQQVTNTTVGKGIKAGAKTASKTALAAVTL